MIYLSGEGFLLCNITAERRRVFPVVFEFWEHVFVVVILCGPAGGAQTSNASVFRGVDFGFWSKLGGKKCHVVEWSTRRDW